MNAHIITGGTSSEGDGIFSTLSIGRDTAAEASKTVAHIVITGDVAAALLLGENRDTGSENELDDLLAVIAAWADRRLAKVMASPEARAGRGIVLVWEGGECSEKGHRLALANPPKVVGLDHAQQLATTANEAQAA